MYFVFDRQLILHHDEKHEAYCAVFMSFVLDVDARDRESILKRDSILDSFKKINNQS